VSVSQICDARDTIFRFELNLREALILGIVGAGGIGYYI